jgi:hypothetical protein
MKSKFAGNRTKKILVVSVLTIAVLFIIFISFIKPKMADVFFVPVWVNDVKKIQLVSDMRVNLNASVEAEKSAVLADTDAVSQAYADMAQRLSDSVEAARVQLGVLIEAEKMGHEVDLFREFTVCWERFREIDRELLPMTVLNTNLKAYKLSFDASQHAVRQLEESINTLIRSRSEDDNSCKFNQLAMHILVAALKIHAFQSPHIAESQAGKMDEIEAAMRMLHVQVMESLDALSSLTSSDGKPLVDEVHTAYTDFWRINTEIMKLSRQNSNVQSLALSLGQKRTVTTQCQDVLAALEKETQNKVYKATR